MIKKRSLYIITSLFLVLSFPVSVLADTAPDVAATPTDTTAAPTTTPAAETAPNTTAPVAATQAPAAATQGTSSPTGADSNTYTYNSTTGLWENPYYTWDPASHQTSPTTPQEYSYNPATGMWDTTNYVYDAPSGTYVPNVVSSAVNPNQPASLQANNNISNTGPDSTNTTNTNSSNNAFFNLFYNAQISNTLSQNAVSGAAAVIGNTVGGDAISGNAMDVMNVINMLKSTFGLQNAADLMTFSANINGNVVGDLYIDPNMINNQSVAVANSDTNNNVTINANGSGLINNDITLGSTSGSATVDSNTNAGSATTGNADAIANIVNMINSAVSANKSFLGVININGNLDGDILLPPNFLDQLIASNAPHSTVALNNNTTNNLTANTTNNETISNDVSLAAASGNANVFNNTNAGGATSGAAKTNLTIFNLTGKQVVAKDSILVFVNVLGQWVGLIMDAPAGTTAAAIGGNVTSNNNVNNNVEVNSETNNVINNNLNINSNSGDATVSNNTNAGGATTGNASASANIANIIDSQLSASDWFGLLFINVLGIWHGSFGIDTDAGNILKQAEQTAQASTGGQSGGGATPAHVAVFGFVPRHSPSYAAGVVFNQPSENSSVETTTQKDEKHPVILASSLNGGHGGPKANAEQNNAASTSSAQKQNIWVIPAASFGLVMLATSFFGGTGELTDKIHARMLTYRLKRS
jgi:hypothetical protein